MDFFVLWPFKSPLLIHESYIFKTLAVASNLVIKDMVVFIQKSMLVKQLYLPCNSKWSFFLGIRFNRIILHYVFSLLDTVLGLDLLQSFTFVVIVIASCLISGHLLCKNTLCFGLCNVSLRQFFIQNKAARLNTINKAIHAILLDAFLAHCTSISVEHLYNRILDTGDIVNIKILSHNLVLLNLFKLINCVLSLDNNIFLVT
nr:MAG TPA: hypothetical protein [Bacteriophage sp.]